MTMAWIWIWVGALAVYAVFLLWQENWREKLTPAPSCSPLPDAERSVWLVRVLHHRMEPRRHIRPNEDS